MARRLGATEVATGQPSVLHMMDRLFVAGQVEVSAIGDLVSGPQTVFSRESLDRVLYLYLLDGKADVTLSDAGRRTLAADDILVVFPGRFVTVELAGESNRLMVIALSGHGAVDASLNMGYWDLFSASEHYEGNFMTEIIERFHVAPQHGRDSQVLALVEQLLSSVWLRARNGSGVREICDAVRTVNRLPAVGLTTDAAAEALCISRSKLNALFVKELGVRPGEYLSQIVLARSLGELYWTQTSVAQIARKMGFSSASAFATFLRRRIGKSPAEFRNRPIPR